ncbi:aquaglyceroporin [Trichophyton tonsurans CBS 112818]|uniref:Aquaporin-3 n=2 Tax=Trichophyton TaxID=5550 RepID=F2PH11_TRIEC|nr:aquaglyceroporin [Trichophyton tonsurans CBS 112818]EGE01179.1 aquaporin-3 [Trichophyton equinum CBS 127.97]
MDIPAVSESWTIKPVKTGISSSHTLHTENIGNISQGTTEKEHSNPSLDGVHSNIPGFSEPLKAQFTPRVVIEHEPQPVKELLWTKIRTKFREPFAEFFGVFIMILFGDGVVAQVVLSDSKKGDYQSISWGWGLGVMLGVYCSGGISGGHLNPAVTFANCVFRKFPWRKFPIYTLAQFLGAFGASGVVYANYKSAITTFEGGPDIRTVGLDTSTAGIFCTYPAPFLTKTGQFFSEFIASTILMFCIYAMADDKNLGAGKLMPLGLFFLIFGIGACFGWETGYAINLARDFGPRLMSYFLGYGHEVWSAGGYYFWVPMVAPFFGCLFGGFLYDVFLYTGESPINTPWMGLDRFIRPNRDVWSNTKSIDGRV